MEGKWRWVGVAAVAPISWGANYVVMRSMLPAGAPLWGSALRALPAGLILLILARRLPRGAWWWRAAVTGTLNVGAFFVLIYAAAQMLPASVASTVMAASPVAIMAFAWALLGERPTARRAAGGVLGLAGVALLVLAGVGAVSAVGVAASFAAMAMSSLGFALTKKWGSGARPLDVAAWQLVVGGVGLVAAALLVEGAPPAFGARGIAGLAYTSLIATALAYVAWFAALPRLDAGAIGLIGLLNPLTGVALGAGVAGESLDPRQWAGVAVVLVSVALGQSYRRGAKAGREGAPEVAELQADARKHYAKTGHTWAISGQAAGKRSWFHNV